MSEYDRVLISLRKPKTLREAIAFADVLRALRDVEQVQFVDPDFSDDANAWDRLWNSLEFAP